MPTLLNFPGARWPLFIRSLLVATIAATALTGCDAVRPTESGTAASSIPPRQLPSSPSANFEPIPGGPYTLAITDSMSPGATVSLPAFSRRLLLRATITGSVSTRLTVFNDGGPSQPQTPGAPRTFGPAGFYYGGTPPNVGCGAQVIVSYGSTGGGTSFAAPCAADGSTDGSASAVGYLYSSGLNDPGSAIRSGSDPNLGQCSTYASGTFSGYGPCFSFSGSQTVSLDRVTADFDATVSPSQVPFGGTVTVTASITPSSAGGLSIPWSVDSTQWTYSVGGFQLQPCGSGNFTPTTGDPPSRTCTATVTRSGTLTVFATVNGQTKQKAVPINVIPPKVKITANPKILKDSGAVTFSAAMTPSNVAWNIESWVWTPDTPSGGISGGCAWFENPCTRTVYKSGVMTVVAKAGEHIVSDSVHVWVIPCPVGDSIADNVPFRQFLMAQQDTSKNEGLERGGVVLRNLITGTDSIVFLAGLTRAACYVGWGLQFPPTPGYKVIAFWHTHWAPNGYSCTDKDGNSYNAGQGLSEWDWYTSRLLYCALYTIDGQKLWKINPVYDEKLYKTKRPVREVERDPYNKKCPANIPWPASVPGENIPPYTC